MNLNERMDEIEARLSGCMAAVSFSFLPGEDDVKSLVGD